MRVCMQIWVMSAERPVLLRVDYRVYTMVSTCPKVYIVLVVLLKHHNHMDLWPNGMSTVDQMTCPCVWYIFKWCTAWCMSNVQVPLIAFRDTRGQRVDDIMAWWPVLGPCFYHTRLHVIADQIHGCRNSHICCNWFMKSRRVVERLGCVLMSTSLRVVGQIATLRFV